MRATFVTLALVLAAAARPSPNRLSSRQDFALKNGQDAIALNDKFKTLTADSPCQAGDQACINNGFAQCVSGKFVVQGCAAGTICAALPLNNSPGTTIACTTQADLDQRIAASGAQDAGAAAGGNANAGNNDNNNGNNNNNNNNGNDDNNAGAGDAANNTAAGNAAGANNAGAGGAAGNAGGDPQTSLTLDPAVIASGFANDGQDVPAAGQVASLTSTNNFINFCLTRPDLPITNGKQIETGSCNPAPIGVIPSTDNMPSSKFTSPANGDTVTANKLFTVSMAVKNLVTGNFVNAKENYFAAPQQLDGNGQIIGHTHIVIELLTDLAQTTPTDPKKFAYFKGVNGAAVNGVVTADVTDGVAPGSYRLCSINAAANHQPVIVPIAQHGSLDDCVYFTAA